MPPLPPNPLGIKIIAFSAAGLFADFVVVSLRLWARKLRKQRLAVGDWLIVASWVSFLIYISVEFSERFDPRFTFVSERVNG